MDARFIAACASRASIPQATLPEVAVAGRSNCGKSSLINALTWHSKLARTSSTPGRTRQINIFSFSGYGGPPMHLVDLPGYGYARASKAEQSDWSQLINAYLETRSTLRLMLVLLDIRRGPQSEEMELLQWMTDVNIPTLAVLTKTDKIAPSKRKSVTVKVARALALQRSPLAFSVKDKAKVLELRKLLAEALVYD